MWQSKNAIDRAVDLGANISWTVPEQVQPDETTYQTLQILVFKPWDGMQNEESRFHLNKIHSINVGPQAEKDEQLKETKVFFI